MGDALTSPNSKRELKPAIVSAFGDIATAIGPEFAPYLEFVLKTCTEASNIQPEDGTIETLDYVFNVREAVLDCFVGIVGGFINEARALAPAIGTIFEYIHKVALDPQMSSTESVARSAAGLLGDIAAMYPNGEFKAAYAEAWVTDFIKRTRSNPLFDNKTKDAARWARDQQKRQQQLLGQ